MNSALTERKREELHCAVLEYLHASGYTASFDALRRECALPAYAPDARGRFAGLLEKKWVSTIRLQKKNMELEARVAALEQELQAAPSARRGAALTEWVPRAPARHVLVGHRQPVTSVAFHPRFSVVATASEDTTIKVWDWETGELERTLKGHTKPIQQIEFDSEGHWLVSCSSDLAIKLWNVDDDWRNARTLYGHEHSISDVRFLPGDQQLISASRDRTLKVWEASSGYCARTLHGHTDWVRAVDVAEGDARLVASASSDYTARLFDLSSGDARAELRGHEHVVECVAFAPVAAYASICQLAGLPAPQDDAARAPGRFLATGSRDKTVRLWTQQGQCLRTLRGHDNWVRGLVFAPSGKHLVTVSDDKTMRVWELATGRCVRTTEAHAHFVTCIAWGRSRVEAPGAPAGGAPPAAPRTVNVVATGSVDLSVKIWAP